MLSVVTEGHQGKTGGERRWCEFQESDGQVSQQQQDRRRPRGEGCGLQMLTVGGLLPVFMCVVPTGKGNDQRGEGHLTRGLGGGWPSLEQLVRERNFHYHIVTTCSLDGKKEKKVNTGSRQFPEVTPQKK